MNELKDILKEKAVNFGTKSTLKKLRQGSLKKIFLASNCPDRTKNDIKYYAKLSKVEVVQLEIKNDELGVTCKKPFSVSVVSI